MAASDENGWKGDRRAAPERRTNDRRSGADRRVADHGRAEGDRRAAAERRSGRRRSGKDRRSEAGWQPIPLDAAVAVVADDAALVAAAVDAREHARARFSNFKVGAALETSTGEVVTGCNIENATYGLTICAERVAMFKALSEGHREFRRVVVVADTEAPTPPCGACRQILWEFGGDLEVILANLKMETGRHRLSDLLPSPFDARLLK